MKVKSLILAVGMLTLLGSCEKDTIIGGGTVKTEDREVSDFTKVAVEGSTNIHITKGSRFDVSVKAYKNLLPYLKTRVENNTLIVKYENSTSVGNDNSQVFITMPVLNGVSATGSGDIDVKGIFEHTPGFDAHISGSSDISIENARAENLVVSISGSGDFKSFGLSIEDANISISGSGDVEITVNKKLKTKISGSGNIFYKGNPATVDNNISGSGKVVKK
ncbi:MAG: DUF2807 domain-containing protein [Chitinophagaceae bacterium]|nr:DUF2807 domain-containing protein [Chitinophagaceae bacterium]